MANDEPWLPHRTPLEAYPPGSTPTVPATPEPPAPTLGPRIRAKAALVRDRLRDQGVAATVRASGRWLRRRLRGDRAAG